MENTTTKAAAILATGMVLAAVLILLAAHLASARVSGALVKAADVIAGGLTQASRGISGGLVQAGVNARPNVAVPGFPTALRVQLEQPPRPLKPEDRERLEQAFVQAVSAATTMQGQKVSSVRVTSLDAPGQGTHLKIEGTLRWADASKDVAFESYLQQDRFGAFTGYLGTKGEPHDKIERLVVP